MQILQCVRVGDRQYFHARRFGGSDPRQGIFDDQAGVWREGMGVTLAIQGGQCMQKRLGVGLALRHVLCTRNMSKCLPDPRLFQDQLYFSSQGARSDGRRVGSGRFGDKLSDAWENHEVILD